MKHRIAIIGLGGMGTWHLNELETMDTPEVAGIWDIKEERRAYARSRKFLYTIAWMHFWRMNRWIWC